MGRRSDKRSFSGIKETRKLKRVVVCGGKVLRHKALWIKHGDDWRKELEQERNGLVKSAQTLNEHDQLRLEGLENELANWPDKAAIERMPTEEKLRETIYSMVRRTTEFMAYFSRLLLFHVHRCLDAGLPLPAFNHVGLQQLRQICSPGGREHDRQKNRTALPDFAASVDLFASSLPQPLHPKLLFRLNHVTNYDMAQHAVAISNHLVYNFTKRCERWLKYRAAQLEPDAKAPTRNKMVAVVVSRLYSEGDEEEDEDEDEEPAASKVREEFVPDPYTPTTHETTSMDTMFREMCELVRGGDSDNSMDFPVTKDWLKERTHWPVLLRFYRTLNALFVEHNLRRFDLLPLCSFRSRCITIDNETFCNLFGIPDKQHAATTWSWFLRLSYVHLDRFPGPYQTTPSSVLTDGVKFIVRCETFLPKKLPVQPSEILTRTAVGEEGGDGAKQTEEDLDKQMDSSNTTSISTTSNSSNKKKKRKRKRNPNEPIVRRRFEQIHGVMRMAELEDFPGPVDIVGVDPGAKDLYAVVDAENHYSRLTRKQLDHLTGLSGDRKRLDKWKHKAGIQTLENSIATSSVSSATEFQEHAKTFFAVASRLLDFYGARRVTRMRMKHYVRRDKVLDGFINQVFLDRPPPISKRTRMRWKRRDRRKRKRAKWKMKKAQQEQLSDGEVYCQVCVDTSPHPLFDGCHSTDVCVLLMICRTTMCRHSPMLLIRSRCPTCP